MFFMKPTRTQFPFDVQKQSKAIKKTTLNWEIGPYLVYLHAVDIINQLHCTFSPAIEKQKEYFMQKEGRKQFHPKYANPVRFVPRFIGLTTDIYVRPPSTKSLWS